jgi:integrase
MTKRADLYREGPRGDVVRVYETTHRGAKVYRCEFRTHGKRSASQFPHTRAGKAEAMAFAAGVREVKDRPEAPAAPLTVEQVFQRFAAEEFAHLRPNTVRIYRENWARWQNFVGPHLPAQDMTRESMVQFRAHLEGRGLAVNTIQRCLVTVRRVYRYAEDARLIPPSTVLRYVFKVGKDKRPTSPAEFSPADATKILAALTGWRPKLAMTLVRYTGSRQHAVLHLDWRDVDFAGRTLTWRAAWDKLGREETSPMHHHVYDALWARWEAAGRPTAGWVIPGPSGAPYTIQSLWSALKVAEVSAEVPHLVGRGGHGLRRLLAGDVAQVTGNPKMALDAIRDRDPKMLERYVQRRDEPMREALAKIDPVPYSRHTPEKDNAPAAGQGVVGTVLP